METLIKSTALSQTNTAAVAETKKNALRAFWDRIEFSRFGIISMLVIIIGCVGGVAAAFGAHGSVPQLAMVAFPTIISLALVLAVAPMRVILYMSACALVLDLIVLIF